MADVPATTLNNGVEMPRIGFGVFRVSGDETVPAVLSAIEVGYRGIDTASLYGNETAVGTAVARCGLRREQLFITTKLWNDDQGYESAFGAFDASLGRLGLDYVDLYLIHWPVPAKSAYLETWKAFEEIYASGRARAIGVSNFQPWHLQPLLDRYRIVPAVNQVELHPRFQQEQVRAFDRAHGIVTEAWSPLAQGDILADPVITALSRRYGKTPAQMSCAGTSNWATSSFRSRSHRRGSKRTSTSSTSRSAPATWPRSARSTAARGPALTPTAVRGRLASRVLMVAGCLRARLSAGEGSAEVGRQFSGNERSALRRQPRLRRERQGVSGPVRPRSAGTGRVFPCR